MTLSNPINSKIVHKDHTDDILIHNFCDIIPAWIDGKLVENLYQTWSVRDAAVFDSAYRAEGELFVLRGVPLYLNRCAAKDVPDFEIDLSQYYSPVHDQLLLTARYLPKTVEAYLRQRFLPDVAPVAPDDARAVAELLGLSPAWLLARVSSYTVLNDTTNYFFYRKPHEHVPGLMLIEIARQAMYHYFYSFSGYERGEVSISISNLSVEFSTYTESTYGVEVLVTQAERLVRNKPRFVDKVASFYQKGRLVAKVRLEGGAMKMNLFRRMRALNFPEDHWFVPSERMSSQVLIGTESGLPIQAKLIMLSVRLIHLSVSSDHIERLCTAKDVSLHISGMGFLCLPVTSIAATSGDGTLMAEVGTASRELMAALKEAIKCHCFFVGRGAKPALPPTLAEPTASLISETA